MNVPKRDLILSETATMVEQLADRLQAGDVVDGVVTKLADFGAFVSIRSPDDGQMHGAVVSPSHCQHLKAHWTSHSPPLPA